MRPEIKIYIAAKLEHAEKLAALRVDGIHINSSWIDTAAVHRKRMVPVTHWQEKNFDDIVAAHFVILYLEPGDKLKGALGEAFYAVAKGKQVWIAGDGHGVEVPIYTGAPDSEEGMRVPHRDILPWSGYAQAFHVAMSLDIAFEQIKTYAFPRHILDSNGRSA